MGVAFIISVSFTTLCILLMICVLLQLLRTLYCSSSGKSVPILPFIKVMSICCFTFAIFVSSFDLSHIAISKILNIPVISPQFVFEIPVMTLADIAYFILSMTVYLLIIGRLYFTFQQTKVLIFRIITTYFGIDKYGFICLLFI